MKNSSAQTRMIMHLLSGADVATWISLMRFSSVAGRVKVYEHPAGSLRDADDVPWPVVWLLSSFNPKFIFASQAMPNHQVLTDDLRTFVNKFKWRWFHGGRRGSTYIKLKGSKTPEFNKMSTPTLDCWTNGLRRAVAAAASASQLRHRGRPANTFPLVRLAFSLLRRINMVAVPNDKEVGFTLVQLMDDRRIDLSILTTDVYKSLDDFSCDFTHVWKKYARVARDIEEFDGVEGLSGQIIRSVYISGTSLTARLAKTCKTHNNPVTLRD